MIRAMLYAAAATAFMALSASMPTQAAVVSPDAINAAPAGLVQEVHYYHHRYYWHHRYWRHRSWHCWRTRVYRHGRHYWVRRCGWRYY